MMFKIMLMTECWTKVSLASALLPVDNCLSLIPAFRHQGQSGSAGHGIVRHCPAMLHRNKKNFMLDRFKKNEVDFESAWKVAEKCVLELKNRKTRMTICFGCFSVCFLKPISWCISLFRTCVKTTETKKWLRNKQKKIFCEPIPLGSTMAFLYRNVQCSAKLL